MCLILLYTSQGVTLATSETITSPGNGSTTPDIRPTTTATTSDTTGTITTAESKLYSYLISTDHSKQHI